jgi:hypothetical protein
MTTELINYLNREVGKLVNLYNQHHDEDKLIWDLGVFLLKLSNTKYYNKYDNRYQLENIMNILCDKTLPIMVRINLAFGAYISWEQLLLGVPRGEKRNLEGCEIYNSKRCKY